MEKDENVNKKSCSKWNKLFKVGFFIFVFKLR